MDEIFLYGFSLGLGDVKASVDPIDKSSFSVKVGKDVVGRFDSLDLALSSLHIYLKGTGRYEEAILKQIKDVRYWDRYFVDTFVSSASS